jgi:hypothetical protein
MPRSISPVSRASAVVVRRHRLEPRELEAVVLVSATLADANPTVLALATAIGLLAALVQFLGLVRWPFAVPHLARLAGDPATTPATRDAVEVTFQTGRSVVRTSPPGAAPNDSCAITWHQWQAA